MRRRKNTHRVRTMPDTQGLSSRSAAAHELPPIWQKVKDQIWASLSAEERVRARQDADEAKRVIAQRQQRQSPDVH
jgi:hypothetical protein